MSSKEKYIKIFAEVFQVEENVVTELKYQVFQGWDSIGHMNLISTLEDEFDIIFDTDDIIDFNSFEKGVEILKRYDVEI